MGGKKRAAHSRHQLVVHQANRQMTTDIVDYYSKGCGRCERFATADCSVQRWQKGLRKLRAICRGEGLTETVKWGHPCYMYGGRNVVILGAFREDFRMTFFNASLLKDPHGVLEKKGPNTQNPDIIKFDKNESVASMEPVLRAYLREAMSYAEAGVKPQKKTRPLEIPEELSQVFVKDGELAKAFSKLTPGRQRSYVINLNSAKKPETRFARIERFRDKIIEGKGAMER